VPTPTVTPELGLHGQIPNLLAQPSQKHYVKQFLRYLPTTLADLHILQWLSTGEIFN
jgi:hypothetical protein